MNNVTLAISLKELCTKIITHSITNHVYFQQQLLFQPRVMDHENEITNIAAYHVGNVLT